MSRIAYVNGRYLPRSAAKVSIEDRGYQFADGVYEVCEVRAGRLVDERRHMARLDRSLNELRIARPMSPAALAIVLRETVRRNRVRDGIVYLQITRGAARRDFPFPPSGTKPSVVVTARSNRPGAARTNRRPKASPSSPCPTSAGAASTSNRWRCCPMCWPNRRRASRARAKPGWSTRKGRVTEGASSNAWIVSRDGKLITRPLGRDILPGITRSVVIDVIKAQGLAFEERAFTVEEAYAAREAFITSASQIVLPVVSASTAGRSAMARPG